MKLESKVMTRFVMEPGYYICVQVFHPMRSPKAFSHPTSQVCKSPYRLSGTLDKISQVCKIEKTSTYLP